jgi:hypothetical protein
MVLVSGLAFNVSAAEFKELRNEEFRFSVNVPSDMVSCESASGGHRHGFGILLDPPGGGCDSKEPQSYIGFFGDYNVLESRSPKEAMRLLCVAKSTKSRSLHRLSLAFSGHKSAACEKDAGGGWVNVFVTAQADRWPDDPNRQPGMPYINYTAELHTTQARFAADLKTFKGMLARVSLFQVSQ